MKLTLPALLTLLSLFTILALPAQTITTIAGTPTVTGFSGAGGPATSILTRNPFNVVVDNSGNVYFTDPSNQCIWKVNTAGIATLFAGNGTYGHTGDGGPATAALVENPGFLTIDNAGDLYFSESGRAIRKIDASGIITTIITEAQANGGPSTGDGGPLSAATFTSITKFVPDNAGNFYVSDVTAQVVRKINTAGIVSTIAGTGTTGFSGDGGPATAAQLNYPYSVAFDMAGNMYIADEGNNRIRKVDAAGIITTVAGNGTAGFSGNGGPATNAEFNSAMQVAFDAAGNMYIDDANNNCVRKVDNTGTITAYAGLGGAAGQGYSGDGGPASAAKMNGVECIALDNAGNLYLTDMANAIVRKVTSCLSAPPTITIATPLNTICSGTTATFTATTTNGGTTPAYQWQLNGTSAGANNNTYSNTTLNNGDIVSCVLTSNSACATTPTATSNALTMTVNPTVSPSISIAGPASPICAGSPTNFTATATNGGAIPGFQWQVNGVNVGTNKPTYKDLAPNDADLITCTMTTSAVCATNSTATSNSLTLTVNPLLTTAISITGPGGPICAGSQANFTATSTNGGTTPIYQWQLNGTGVGPNNTTYSNPNLNNGDVISCVLTSNAVCPTSLTTPSNAVTMNVDPLVTPAVSITTPLSFVCAGLPASFTASPTNGGSAPAFQWSVNGTPISASGATYTNSSLNNGDVVSCVMTSNAACLTTLAATSNSIAEPVKTSVGSSVRIDASANAICSGTQVTFTATPDNGGATPTYQWQVNGNNAGPDNALFTTNDLANDDIISCILTSSLYCTVPTASENQVTMTVNPNPTIALIPDTIIGLGQSIALMTNVTGPVTSYQWTPADALDNAMAATPVATPDNTTTYQLIVTTDANCTATGKVTVGVFKTLKMPSAFTPNGDGKNDLFRIPPSLAVKISAFAVYDRWGSMVFHTSNSGVGWDGTSGGQPQPTGTYVWMIDYADLITGKPAQARGTVILVR